MKIGITGANGFVGKHLNNFLLLQNDIEIVPFDRVFFEEPIKMDGFVRSCDCIVHLAGLNRHSSPELMFETNVILCVKIVEACQRTFSKPHIIFSSSTQEEEETIYGDSKRKGREVLESWAKDCGALVTGAIIPNVFGPFGVPFYNSVIATFCHQIVNKESPTIIQDKTLNLIYINDLVVRLYGYILTPLSGRIEIPHNYTMRVSDILSSLIRFKDLYLHHGIIPDLSIPFELDLFNTFRCYVPKDHYPVFFKLNTDERGSFVEIARTNTSGQFSYSTTKPGITRGNHFHTRKVERFAVIQGKAKISLRRIDSDEVLDYFLDGKTPSYVDMPIWYTHNITNIGEDDLVTLFWINEPYNVEDPDTWMENV
ncbi:MAG: NAD-dependent epimerase/dehydratase family protein [Saprospiraceae bacterium]